MIFWCVSALLWLSIIGTQRLQFPITGTIDPNQLNTTCVFYSPVQHATVIFKCEIKDEETSDIHSYRCLMELLLRVSSFSFPRHYNRL